MIKFAAWDWNGTVLADTQICIDGSNHIVKTYGGTPVSRGYFTRNFHFPVESYYCIQGCNREELAASKHMEQFHRFYELRAANSRTRRGARDALSHLKKKGVKSVILSRHTRDRIQYQLGRLHLNEYFDGILANAHHAASGNGSGKIGIMRNYIYEEKVDPRSGLIIGDSPEDISIGKELGMKTVAVTGGFFSDARLREEQPDYTIRKLAELISVIDGLNPGQTQL